MSFRRCLGAGKVGENLVTARFLARADVSDVEDVSDNPRFRDIGVDLVVRYADGRPDLWVDVKTDSHAPKNVFLETVSNCDTGSLGCFLYSEAHAWVVWYSQHDVALWLPIPEAREWFDASAYRVARASTPVGNGAYQTEGRLVPIREILAGVHGAALVPFPGVMTCAESPTVAE